MPPVDRDQVCLSAYGRKPPPSTAGKAYTAILLPVVHLLHDCWTGCSMVTSLNEPSVNNIGTVSDLWFKALAQAYARH
jgi:hypothetical protein